jgi:hypothetical protein
VSETFEQMIEQLNDDLLGQPEGAAVEPHVEHHLELIDVARERRGWSVTLRLHTGSVRRYRYGSEAQARFFAAVFALGPRVLPSEHAAAAPRRRRRSARVAQPAALP